MSITAARGFLASGVACGLKASGRPDLGLLVSEGPASAAGVFTTNLFAAAPVLLCRDRLAGGFARAVVTNSGQANAGTGPEGLRDAMAIAAGVAVALGVPEAEVLACSTGVIGPRIDVSVAMAGVAKAAAALGSEGGPSFARAIMTTDRVPKEALVETGGYAVGGCAKGAGMIAPNLATLLVFLTTDAMADPETVRHAVTNGAGPVWNSVTVDGCSSTNDSVLLLANGASGVAPHRDELTEAVAGVCRDLARQVVADAEGATTTLVVQVDGAGSEADARRVGLAVAGSALVKTALFGRDPNPGRVLQAIGASGVDTVPHDVEAALGPVPIIREGRIPPQFDPQRCREAMKDHEVLLRVRLGDGLGSATVFGCDLSYEYVRINGEYTT